MNNTALCDDCESIQNLSEDGYCLQCGKHYDNMPAGRMRDGRTTITMEDRIKSSKIDPYGEIY